jgi:hypothetical protein
MSGLYHMEKIKSAIISLNHYFVLISYLRYCIINLILYFFVFKLNRNDHLSLMYDIQSGNNGITTEAQYV